VKEEGYDIRNLLILVDYLKYLCSRGKRERRSGKKNSINIQSYEVERPEFVS
jgi:hypothetical protein